MKLFEMEALEEGVRQVRNIKGICVLMNDHYFDQCAKRQIPEELADAVVKRIPDVRNKIKPLEENQKFYVWSKSANIGVGLRQRLPKDGIQRVEVMTAVYKSFDSDAPVFYVG